MKAWKARLLWVIGVLAVLAFTGCRVSSSNDVEFVSDDQELAKQLLAGWLAPEEMYEVRDVSCVKLDDRVEMTMTVVNNNDFSWPFGVETIFYTSDGEALRQTTDPGFWEPGQEVELSDWSVPPEDFDDPPRCEVVIYHGADLAFRDPDRRAKSYERLGWDPVNEKRIDGS